MKKELILIFTLMILKFNAQTEDFSDNSRPEFVELSTMDYVLPWILPLLIIVLWLISLVSALKSEYKYPSDKLVWVLISFLPILGPILFFVIGRKQLKIED